MAFASFNGPRASAPTAEINMVPLIDVMLVLLVIFILTAPLLTHAVKLDLPRVDAAPNVLKPEKVEVALNAQGQRFWNGEPVDRAGLQQRLGQASQQQPQPELHLRADQAVPYREVALTLADAARAGMAKVGFVSQPEQP
jgi:biopolymer transport protein ExbD